MLILIVVLVLVLELVLEGYILTFINYPKLALRISILLSLA